MTQHTVATGHTKWSKINASPYSLCFTGKAKRGGRCDHCLSAAHKSEDCSIGGDEDPDIKKQIKAIESVVISQSSKARGSARGSRSANSPKVLPAVTNMQIVQHRTLHLSVLPI